MSERPLVKTDMTSHRIPRPHLCTEHILNRESNIFITVHTQFIALSLAQFLSDLWLRYRDRDHVPKSSNLLTKTPPSKE